MTFQLLHASNISLLFLNFQCTIQLFYSLCFRLNSFPEGNIHVHWLMAKMGFCSSKNLTDVLQVMPSYYQLKRTMRKRHSENTKKTWDPDTSSFFDPRQPKFSKYVNCYLNTTYTSGLEWVYIRNQGSRNSQTLTFFVFCTNLQLLCRHNVVVRSDAEEQTKETISAACLLFL